jgi:predicted small secreted protein
MQSVLSLIVSGNTSGTTNAGGELDLFGNEEINLVLSVKDFRDIASTTSSYSQSFSIPGSKNNNQIFQNLFLIGSDGRFDPRKKATCWLLADSQPVMEGYLQITSVDIDDRDMPTYNITIFSDVKGFNSAVNGKYLTDYDWSSMNHALTINNIQASWSGNATTPGYYYSLKDYGYDYTKTNVKTTTQKAGIPIGNMFPDIYNLNIIDKIFSTEGYSYQSSLLTSTTFNQTVIPYNRDPNTIMGADYVSGRTFVATNTVTSAITVSQCVISPYAIAPYTYDFEYRLRANNVFSGTVASTAYTQNNATGDTYTIDQNGIYSFSFGVNYQYNVLANAQRGQIGCRFYRSGYNNGTVPFYEELSLSEVGGTPSFAIFSTPVCDNVTNNGWAAQTFKPFSAGERVWVSLFFRVNLGYVAPTMSNVPFNITTGGIYWKSTPSAQRAQGQTVIMNNVVPEKVLVTDYLKSIFNMFNVYLEPSKTVPNRFTIETFEEFYAGGTQLNWSTKLDRSQPVNAKLISEELKKKYTFTYKADSDFLNEDYKNTTKRVYGDLNFDLENDFVTGEEKIELLFSPTPMDNIVGSDTFIVPKIGKYDSNGKFGKTNFNMRFLRKNPTNRALVTGESWGFTGTSNYTSYPYAGHLDDPFTGTTDYNFGSVPYVYYKFNQATNGAITENNLVNNYWIKYLREVTDEDAKVVTAYFNLTPADIATFSFRNTVYVEGISSEGGHMYRINTIKYSPNSGKPAEVEMIKVLTKYISKIRNKSLIFGMGTATLANTGINLGGSQMNSTRTLSIGGNNYLNAEYGYVIGEGNIIGGGSVGTGVLGDNNYLSSASSGVTVFGSNNTLNFTTSDSIVRGNSNSLSTGTTKAYVRGNNNFMAMADNIRVDGNNNIVNANSDASAPSVNISLAGTGNVTFGSSTGVTVDGQDNYIYGGTKNSYLRGISNAYIGAVDTFTVGYNNSVTSTQGSTILGDTNNINSGINSFVKGNSNTYNGSVLNGENINTTVFGSDNTMYWATTSAFVVGDFNDVTDAYGINLNGNRNTVSQMTGSSVVGDVNNVSFLKNSSIIGSGNTVYSSNLALIQGISNIVYTASTNATIIGSNNIVHSGATNSYIVGDGNVIPTGITNTSMISIQNFTADTSDTLFTDNQYVDTVLYMSNTSSSEQADGIAAGNIANAFGSGGTASGNYSFTSGYNNVADGYASFATGFYSDAIGDVSFVYGRNNSASGDSSFAGGEFCTTEKDFSFVGGKEAVAKRYAEWARANAGNYGQYGSVQAFGTSVASGSSNLYLSIASDIFTIEAGTSYMFKIRGTAADYAFTSSGMSACFEGSILLKNVAGTVSAVGVPIVTQLFADSAVATSTISLAADNVGKGLSIVGSSGTGPGMIWSVEIDYVKVKHNPL